MPPSIAGNPPEERVEKLQQFWELVTAPYHQWQFPTMPAGRSASGNGNGDFATLPSQLEPLGYGNDDTALLKGDAARSLLNQWSAARALSLGAPGFFAPRPLTPWLSPNGSIEATSYYDTRPLRTTLERLVDFDRINSGAMRLSVGAVNVRTGNFVYFDSTTHHIRPEHVMASGALPPGFPAIEIDGEHYWDGGLISNTPLRWLVENEPHRDTLAFQVDLWSSRGEAPRNMAQVQTRQKEIQYSSRTRAESDRFREIQVLRNALSRLIEKLPDELAASPEVAVFGLRRIPRSGIDPTRLSIEGIRRRRQRLRVFAPEHGGSLAGGLSRHHPHAEASRSARTSTQPRRHLHVRCRRARPRIIPPAIWYRAILGVSHEGNRRARARLLHAAEALHARPVVAELVVLQLSSNPISGAPARRAVALGSGRARRADGGPSQSTSGRWASSSR